MIPATDSEQDGPILVALVPGADHCAKTKMVESSG
jgi:hypothetical protein